jgi:acetyltransferase-like isoleucine patch superfamily enzyme
MVTPGAPVPNDWYPGVIPGNVDIDPTAHVETSFSFLLFRSSALCGLQLGRGSSTYIGTLFDVGPVGEVCVGDYTLLNGARVIADERVEIGSHCLISWNVVLMDTYRFSRDPDKRREELLRGPSGPPYVMSGDAPTAPVKVGDNVWLGFDVVVLPGVTIGEGAVVGARSVVDRDIPPFTVVAGNPAQPVRRLEQWTPGVAV